MITFREIRYKNFLSTGNNFTTIRLDKFNTNLIVGSNGSGKSTITDAISFALFNKPYRDIRKPQLINSINEKDCLAEIDFTINSHSYTVKRGIKPSIFEVYKDDTLLNQNGDSRDYQEILEKQILNFNYKSFKQILVLGSASFIPFMQLKANERREIIEELLDLKVFSVMNILLKSRLTDAKSTYKDMNQTMLILSNKAEGIKRLIAKINQTNEGQITELMAEIDQIKVKGLHTKAKIDVLNDEILSFQHFNSEFDDENLIKRKVEKNINSLETNRKELQKTIKFFETEEHCPTCEQHINTEHKEGIILTAREKDSNLLDTIKLKTKEVAKHNEKLSDIKVQLKIMTDFASNVQSLMGELKTSASYIKKLMVKLKNLQNTDTDTIDERGELAAIIADLEIKEKELIELKEKSQLFLVAADILKDGGIKTKIIQKYVPMLNTLVNKYLSNMDFFVEFELDENFNETIRSRYRDKFSYASFSEGEKMRIDLSLLLTWRTVARLKNSVKTNLLLLDEVFDSSLDDAGVEDVMKLLNSLEGNIFLISHKGDLLTDKFENTIKFEKKGNYSVVCD